MSDFLTYPKSSQLARGERHEDAAAYAHPVDCPDSNCRHPQCYDLQPEDVGYTLARPVDEDDGMFGPGGYPGREAKLLAGNRALTKRIASLRESAQRSWESLDHYVSTRSAESPCGFCGSWGEHDNDSCDLVAVVASLEVDFGCGEHWRGETIPEEPEGGYARNDDGSYLTPEQSDEGWAVQ